MKTVAERLQFVVEFMQRDLRNLPELEWPLLLNEVRMFLDMQMTDMKTSIAYIERYGYLPGENRTIASHFTQEEDRFPLGRKPSADTLDKYSERRRLQVFRRLQDDLRLILIEAPSKKLIPLSVRIVVRPWTDDGKNKIFALGHPRDVFLYALLSDLTGDEAKKILTCPVCNRIFYKVGKMKYCTHRCTNLAQVRKYHKEHPRKKVKERK